MNLVNYLTKRLCHTLATSTRNSAVTLPLLSNILSVKHNNFVRGLNTSQTTYQDLPSDSDSSDSDSGDTMDLKKVVKKLQAFAPTSLAGSWDNVGLLIEPSPPHVVTSVLLTNDLTLPVLEEAIEKKVNLILSYHPPIFVPLKRLTQRSWKEVVAIRCVENCIAVYSPHTACDAVQGGVNDWLIQPFSGKVDVIERSYETNFPLGGGYRLEFTVSGQMEAKTRRELEGEVTRTTGVTLLASHSSENGDKRLCLNCTEKAVPKVMESLNKQPDIKSSVEIFKCEKPPLPRHGPGRLCKLTSPMSLQQAVDAVKRHLDLTHLRVATATGASYESPVKCVAVCAGSGSSVLRGVEADLYVTGEMSHHEVLDACHHGVSVILCDHSNTERGYLHVLRERLDAELGEEVVVSCSERDRDPLEVR